MIKETIRKEMKEVAVVEKTEYFCDQCGEKIKIDQFDICSNKIQFKHGSRYPDGGYWNSEESFLCDKCATALKSILENAGIKFEKNSCDW